MAEFTEILQLTRSTGYSVHGSPCTQSILMTELPRWGLGDSRAGWDWEYAAYDALPLPLSDEDIRFTATVLSVES